MYIILYRKATPKKGESWYEVAERPLPLTHTNGKLMIYDNEDAAMTDLLKYYGTEKARVCELRTIIGDYEEGIHLE